MLRFNERDALSSIAKLRRRCGVRRRHPLRPDILAFLQTLADSFRESARVLTAIAEVFLRTAQGAPSFTEATEYARLALLNDPNNRRTLHALARCQIHRRDFAEASLAAHRAVSLFGRADDYTLLAEISARQGQARQALNILASSPHAQDPAAARKLALLKELVDRFDPQLSGRA